MAGLAMGLAMVTGCSRTSDADYLIGALDDSAWTDAQWISVADAPVVTGGVNDTENGRSADGASWFVRDFTNEGKVVKARWMTTALGVYQLYVNGDVVGR